MSGTDPDAGLDAALLAPISFARSAEHDRYLRDYRGQIQGRYLLANLAGIEYVGGRDVRVKVEEALSLPHFAPEAFYDIRYFTVIVDRALVLGVASQRLGELIVPTYKRSNPKAFEGKTVAEAFQAMIDGYRAQSSVIEFALQLLGPGHVRVIRGSNPSPCEMFVGTIRGLLRVMNVEGTAEETSCRWRAQGPTCVYDARWTEPDGSGAPS